MPHNDDLDRLAATAKRAAAVPAWHPFSLYLDQRARGIRRASMETAREFITTTRAWTHEQREAFVHWLCEEAESMWDERLLVPHDLLVELVAPTIREWLLRQPDLSVAQYLSGKYCRGETGDPLPLDAFRRSVALDPDFQPPRRAFINWAMGHAENNQHELPWHGYLGDASEDVRDLVDARAMLAGVHHPLWRDSIGSEVSELLEIARAWEAYSRSGETDFVGWCREHDGPIRFTVGQ